VKNRKGKIGWMHNVRIVGFGMTYFTYMGQMSLFEGKVCCKCGLPAVYKDSSGSFDHNYCSEHMPEAVKA